jgi:hypothetical protein
MHRRSPGSLQILTPAASPVTTVAAKRMAPAPRTLRAIGHQDHSQHPLMVAGSAVPIALAAASGRHLGCWQGSSPQAGVRAALLVPEQRELRQPRALECPSFLQSIAWPVEGAPDLDDMCAGARTAGAAVSRSESAASRDSTSRGSATLCVRCSCGIPEGSLFVFPSVQTASNVLASQSIHVAGQLHLRQTGS